MKKAYVFAALKGFSFLILFNVVAMLLLYLLAPTRDNFSLKDTCVLIWLYVLFGLSVVPLVLLQSHKHMGTYLTYSLIPLLGQAPLTFFINKYTPWVYTALHENGGDDLFIGIDFMPLIVCYSLAFVVSLVWFVAFLVRLILAIDHHRKTKKSGKSSTTVD